MSNDIFSTKESFLVAAASYFGLPDGQVMQGSTVEAGADGTLDVVLRVSLTPDDLTGIAGRMKALAEEQVSEPADLRPTVGWTREELREQYNALSKQERSQYGSFARYEAWRGGTDPYTTPEVVAKVDLPAHVYLSPAEATPQQKAMAIGQDEKGNYAIAVEDLTEEQRFERVFRAAKPAKMKDGDDTGEFPFHLDNVGGKPTADALRAQYIERTVAAHERLNGANSKPTGEADDLGGVPG